MSPSGLGQRRLPYLRERPTLAGSVAPSAQLWKLAPEALRVQRSPLQPVQEGSYTLQGHTHVQGARSPRVESTWPQEAALPIPGRTLVPDTSQFPAKTPLATSRACVGLPLVCPAEYGSCHPYVHSSVQGLTRDVLSVCGPPGPGKAKGQMHPRDLGEDLDTWAGVSRFRYRTSWTRILLREGGERGGHRSSPSATECWCKTP